MRVVSVKALPNSQERHFGHKHSLIMPLACGRAVLVTVVNLAACGTLECGRVRDGRSNLSTPTLGKIGKDGEAGCRCSGVAGASSRPSAARGTP